MWQDNIFEFGLFEESNGKQIILSRDYAVGGDDDFRKSRRDETVDEDQSEEAAGKNDTIESPEQRNEGSNGREAPATRVVPQIAFNI